MTNANAQSLTARLETLGAPELRRLLVEHLTKRKLVARDTELGLGLDGRERACVIAAPSGRRSRNLEHLRQSHSIGRTLACAATGSPRVHTASK